MLSQEDHKRMQKEFEMKFQGMLELVARGRGIEILLRIVDQTTEGLKASEDYNNMMNSGLYMPNLHPSKSLPKIFKTPSDKERLELARDIADKLAHALYYQARKLINKYNTKFQLKTKLTSEPLVGWQMHAKGHIIEDDGRKIDTIIDLIKTSNDNLIVEEYDLFVHNKYDKASREIFDDAWVRIASAKRSLSSQVAKLHILRGVKRGERKYLEE